MNARRLETHKDVVTWDCVCSPARASAYLERAISLALAGDVEALDLVGQAVEHALVRGGMNATPRW